MQLAAKDKFSLMSIPKLSIPQIGLIAIGAVLLAFSILDTNIVLFSMSLMFIGAGISLFHAFALIGLGAIIAASTFAYDSISLLHSGKFVEGTVAEIRKIDEETFAHIIEYTDEAGQVIKFEDAVKSSKPLFGINKRVKVIYDPADPSKHSTYTFLTFWAPSVLFGGVGLLFFAFGATGLIYKFKKRKKKEYLIAKGKKITAKFIKAEMNNNLEVNGVHPYRIYLSYEDPKTKKIIVFESENLAGDPTPYIKKKKLEVYVDKKDSKRYYVDTSFIPITPAI